jgi:hypothetical protein
MALLRPLFAHLLFLLLTASLALGHQHRGHQHAHELGHELWKHAEPSQTATTGNTTPGSTSPEDILARAQAIVAELNKARLENPAFNKHEFLAPDDLAKLGKPAPPIDLNVPPGNSTTSGSRRRQEANSTTAIPYTLPPEVIEAARMVAESTPQVPVGNHSEVAASIRQKYSHKLADSHRPSQLQRPEGGLSNFGDGFEMSSNASSPLLKREYGYWMADMAQLGSSPYAPAGYQVCLACAPYWQVGYELRGALLGVKKRQGLRRGWQWSCRRHGRHSASHRIR